MRVEFRLQSVRLLIGEANLTALNATKAMAQKALELMK